MWNYHDGDWQQASAQVDPKAQQQFSEKLERIKLECESARLGLLKTLNAHQLLDTNYCAGLMNTTDIPHPSLGINFYEGFSNSI
jgi:hypothetical protein